MRILRFVDITNALLCCFCIWNFKSVLAETPKPISCTFESADSPLCQWQQVSEDNFDWTRLYGQTSSANTGPQYGDHTTGSSSGYYLYTEVSSKPEWSNARIISPVIDPFDNTCSMTFYYNMYGSGIGYLNVYTIPVDAANGNEIRVWYKDGNQGTSWIVETITFGITYQFQVIIEGVRATSPIGDIAIDDVSFSNSCEKFNQGSLRIVPSDDTTDVNQGRIDIYLDSVWGSICDRNFDIDTEGVVVCIQLGYRKASSSIYNVPDSTSPIIDNVRCYGNETRLLDCGNDGIGSIDTSCNENRVVNLKCSDIIDVCEDVGSDAFHCDNIHCVPASEKCDFTNNCGDNSDEASSICDVYPGRADFEFDYGEWSQPETNGADWSRSNGLEATGGPSRDHHDQIDGYYLVLDGSHVGMKAQLCLDIPFEANPTDCSIRFYYYRNSRNTGTIDLILRTSSLLTEIWSVPSDYESSSQWDFQELIITSSQSFQLCFEATLSSDGSGYLGLDDLSLTPGCVIGTGECELTGPTFICDDGVCVHESYACDHVHHCLDASDENATLCEDRVGYCTFQDGFCEWQQSSSDNLDWTREDGDTPSSNTGPSVDHTLENHFGYYAFLEVSSETDGHYADLLSPWLTINDSTCELRIFYHMYGNDIGDIKCGTITSESVFTALFTESNSRDYWRGTTMFATNDPNIQPGTEFQFVVRATVGGGNAGDIAIDDLSLSEGCIPILDTELPMFTCPSDETVYTASATATVDYSGSITVSDNSEEVLTISPDLSTTFPADLGLGANLLTFTAVDSAGNIGSCTFTIMVVQDTEPPMFTCPSDETLYTASATATVDYSGSITVSDNSAEVLTISPDLSTTFPADLGLGANLLTFTAVDSAGNIGSCTFTIMVVQDVKTTVLSPISTTERQSVSNSLSPLQPISSPISLSTWESHSSTFSSSTTQDQPSMRPTGSGTRGMTTPRQSDRTTKTMSYDLGITPTSYVKSTVLSPISTPKHQSLPSSLSPLQPITSPISLSTREPHSSTFSSSTTQDQPSMRPTGSGTRGMTMPRQSDRTTNTLPYDRGITQTSYVTSTISTPESVPSSLSPLQPIESSTTQDQSTMRSVTTGMTTPHQICDLAIKQTSASCDDGYAVNCSGDKMMIVVNEWDMKECSWTITSNNKELIKLMVKDTSLLDNDELTVQDVDGSETVRIGDGMKEWTSTKPSIQIILKIQQSRLKRDTQMNPGFELEIQTQSLETPTDDSPSQLIIIIIAGTISLVLIFVVAGIIIWRKYVSRPRPLPYELSGLSVHYRRGPPPEYTASGDVQDNSFFPVHGDSKGENVFVCLPADSDSKQQRESKRTSANEYAELEDVQHYMQSLPKVPETEYLVPMDVRTPPPKYEEIAQAPPVGGRVAAYVGFDNHAYHGDNLSQAREGSLDVKFYEFLVAINLHKYAQVFQSEFVVFDDIPYIEADELKDMGLDKKEVNRFLRRAKQYGKKKKLLPNSEGAFDNVTVPSQFLCPLSRRVMKQPVLAADNITYDYENIKVYLETNDKSPVTKENLKDKSLSPNVEIADQLQKFKDKVEMEQRRKLRKMRREKSDLTDSRPTTPMTDVDT